MAGQPPARLLAKMSTLIGPGNTSDFLGGSNREFENQKGAPPLRFPAVKRARSRNLPQKSNAGVEQAESKAARADLEAVSWAPSVFGFAATDIQMRLSLASFSDLRFILACFQPDCRIDSAIIALRSNNKMQAQTCPPTFGVRQPCRKEARLA